MSATYSYPGVYIQELPSPVHTIAGVATSIAAFVGYTPRGIDNRAQSISSFADFERLYGGLASNSELSYAVAQFFQNGGTQAYIVRAPTHGAAAADVTFDSLTFKALSTGTWADEQLIIDADVANVDLVADPLAVNLTITNLLDGTSEFFPNVTLTATARNYIASVVNDPDSGSQLVNVSVSGTPTIAVTPSGVVGDPLTVANVNTAVGGGAANTQASDDFTLTLTTSAPATALQGLPVTIKVFGKNTPIPQSLAGLAAQLQQAINAKLATSYPNASVSCSLSPVSTGQGIRVNALLPRLPDAVIAFQSPGTGGDAACALGLLTPTQNVAHYALGTTSGTGLQGADGLEQGKDGAGLPQTPDLIGDPALFTGLYALQKVDLFNLLCIPDATRAKPSDPTALDSDPRPGGNLQRSHHALRQHAPSCSSTRRHTSTPSPARSTGSRPRSNVTDQNGAAFFPRLRLPDPLNNYKLRTFAPCGVVAGLYATIDATRGVWKAPAGTEATLSGVQSMTYQLTEQENGRSIRSA